MHSSSSHEPLRVVVAGGGVAGLETIMALRALAGDRVAITLVTPETEFTYRPHATARAFDKVEELGLPLAHVVRDFDVELITDAVDWVVPSFHRLFLESGRELGYDALAIAVGGRRYPAWHDALAFGGLADVRAMRALIADLDGGGIGRLAFVVPPGVGWTLPLYELALRTAARARAGGHLCEITIVTPEASPLAIFGADAGAEILHLCEEAGIAIECGIDADVPSPGTVQLPPGRVLECDRVVALPLLEGPSIHGLPSDAHGFIPIDPYCLVRRVVHVYAAGDCVPGPVKQGGLAAQQGDLIAEAIARRAGSLSSPRRFEPVLRGALMDGERRRFFRSGLARVPDRDEVAQRPLWWPAAKIAGTYLAPYLETSNVASDVALADRAGAIPTGQGERKHD